MKTPKNFYLNQNEIKHLIAVVSNVMNVLNFKRAQNHESILAFNQDKNLI